MRLHCTLIWSVATALGAQSVQPPPPLLANLGTCHLTSGDSLPDCRLSYRVYGALNADRTNAVLLPTWFNGASQGWLPFLGRDGYVDTTVFAAIAVDAFGAGRSTSPVDSAWRGRQFPMVTLGDMVTAQRAMLASMGVRVLHAVIGFSMGGMQAFEWAVAYPDAVRRVVSIEGSPRLSTYDRVQWDAMLRVVATEPALGVPRDSSLRQLARMFVMGGSSPAAVNMRSADSSSSIVENQARALSQRSFENLALQIRAMLSHDVTRHTHGDATAAARRVRAKLLVVASPDDHVVTPQSALAFARLIGADTLVVLCSCGHQVFSAERARISPVVRAFLSP